MTEKEILTRIDAIDMAIANYEELDCDMDNPEYIARGNGFCDSKYSEDFIQVQLDNLRRERLMLEDLLSTL